MGKLTLMAEQVHGELLVSSLLMSLGVHCQYSPAGDIAIRRVCWLVRSLRYHPVTGCTGWRAACVAGAWRSLRFSSYISNLRNTRLLSNIAATGQSVEISTFLWVTV